MGRGRRLEEVRLLEFGLHVVYQLLPRLLERSSVANVAQYDVSVRLRHLERLCELCDRLWLQHGGVEHCRCILCPRALCCSLGLDLHHGGVYDLHRVEKQIRAGRGDRGPQARRATSFGACVAGYR